MGYLNINTRSNRVVLFSSVITRIFLTLCNVGRSHFNLFNKDTHDLFYVVHSVHGPVKSFILIIIARYLSLLFSICSTIRFSFICSSTFVFIQFFCFLLFIVSLFKEKKFTSDPGLYSRYFNPAVKNTITIYASKKTSYITLHRLCLSTGASSLLQS
jgi:hypothetical protein